MCFKKIYIFIYLFLLFDFFLGHLPFGLWDYVNIHLNAPGELCR